MAEQKTQEQVVIQDNANKLGFSQKYPTTAAVLKTGATAAAGVALWELGKFVSRKIRG